MTAMIVFFICQDSHDDLVFARRLHGSHNLATGVGPGRQSESVPDAWDNGNAGEADARISASS